ncbi:ureidoglycolate lyase [Robbsia sp. KACC 23696]|uniref:ureidoglycolate lyase n=1 Tax=Robbsia sp. KACC 23696 TaxID=3149231 RepID=UPI00325A91AF
MSDGKQTAPTSVPATMRIGAKALTADAFAPFGQVTSLREAQRRTYLQQAFDSDHAGKGPEIWIGLPPIVRPLPLTIEKMERHPHATQTFVPIETGRYLVVVAQASADGAPDVHTLQAFIADETQAVTYGINVWHHGLTVLDRPSRFVTVMADYRNDDDDVFVPLSEPVEIVMDTLP